MEEGREWNNMEREREREREFVGEVEEKWGREGVERPQRRLDLQGRETTLSVSLSRNLAEMGLIQLGGIING